MKKHIAIVTGASGGIGTEFVKELLKEELDEIWVIARNVKKLNDLKDQFGEKIVPISKDLSSRKEVLSIGDRIKEVNPVILYLINNAGLGKMGSSYQDFTLEESDKTIELNCNTVVSMCTMCIPYMQKGSCILNISSQASFQPVPYLNLYAATKVFERSYSRALHMELEKTGITVTAVCPGWIDTDMLLEECNHHKIKFPGLVSPDIVAQKAMKDTKKGRDMSVCTFYVKYMHFLSKIFPQKIVMRKWVRSIKKYI